MDMVHLCEFEHQSWKAQKVLRNITKVCQSIIRQILLYMKARVYTWSQKELMLHCSAPLVTSSFHGITPPPETMLSAAIKSAGVLAMTTETALNP